VYEFGGGPLVGVMSAWFLSSVRMDPLIASETTASTSTSWSSVRSFMVLLGDEVIKTC